MAASGSMRAHVLDEHAVLHVLGVGQAGHRRLQVQRRCQVGVDGHPDEGGQLAVREDAQQVHDGCAVGGVLDRRLLHGFGA
jgi:hypothetical protein